MKLSNEFKIRFCNAWSEIFNHVITCKDCDTYLKAGDGDMCEEGKTIIAEHLTFANTVPDNIKDYLVPHPRDAQETAH